MASFNVNDIRSYIEKNQKQALAGALVAVIVVAGVLYMVFRPKPADDMTASGGGFEAGAPTAGPNPFGPPTAGGPPVGPPMPGGAPMPGGPPVGPPMPGGPPVGPPMPGAGPMVGPGAAPGAPGAPGGAVEDPFAPAPAAGTAAPTKKAQASRYAGPADPFTPLGAAKVDTARIRAVMRRIRAQQAEQQRRQQLAQLPWISIYRPKQAATTPDQITGQPATPEVPVNRRTSGLLYGDRVLGVLETDGATTIVKPGDVLTSGGERVRVQRIDRDGIVLRRLDSKQPPFRVPIKGSEGTIAGSITAPTPGGYRYGPPMPGGPPIGPPMPGGPPLPPL